jgi:threonine/homoserine/homoserine lactone efflux protein
VAHVAAFFGVALVVIVTPGQDTALTIRNTLAGGRRSGVLTAVGVSTGQCAWTLLTSLGLAALCDLGNPKMALFFTSLLPQFAPHDASFVQLASLGLLFCVTTLLWLGGYALVVARLGDLLRRSRVRRALDAVTGTVLVTFGARLALD